MKSYNHLSWLIIVILFTCSCKSNTKQEPAATIPTEQATDSIESVGHDSVFSKEQIDTFKILVHGPVGNTISDTDWAKFQLERAWVDSLKFTDFTRSKDYYQAYGPYLKYSPDSSMFIDLDSYGILIEKDQSGRWVGSESGPDVEIMLVNTKTAQKSRLLFLGPGNTIDEAYWFNNDDIVLLGTQDDRGHSASIWLYSLPERTFYLYKAKNDQALVETMLRLSNERLKNIRMK
jgi:hypothetical protein